MTLSCDVVGVFGASPGKVVSEVVAKTAAAAAFYAKYGFKSLTDDTLHLYLSMKVVRRLLLR